ncbi:MAG TPA: EAL domain-containing protein [Candidatus Rubrimentiphilum sp.]|nr:EAL domain-containing protein [Candidatus Rubrimentiphilum sp.]
MERQKAHRAPKIPDLHLGAVFAKAAFGIAVLDRSGAVVDANPAFRRSYGTDSAALLAGRESQLSELLSGKRDIIEFEQQTAGAEESEAWTQCSISALESDKGEAHFAICVCRDVTKLKQNERRVLHEMTHDPLTGLPNRLFFESKLREQLAISRGAETASFALLLVDLDHFREINEGFGHDSGDYVVSQVGQRLQNAVGANDMVARIGTDQFAILTPSKNTHEVETAARRLFSAFAKPLAIGTRPVYVSASIGIATGATSYKRSDDMLRDAQIATRYAKASGGSRTATFDQSMQMRADERLQLSTDMRGGLERGEFFLVYQPIVQLDTSEFIGCEALLRWKHPAQGVLIPADFIPLAEQIGLSTQVGRTVLRLACRQLAAWRDERGVAVQLSLNVAWPDLLEAEFEQSLMAITREFSIQPEQLSLEITENIVLSPGARATLVVDRLRKHGFKICIDDFGTGYSSLHYLQQFQIDAMKIDRSFVCGESGEIASEPIIRALLTLADGFKVRVIAEGIETQQQCEALQRAGCRFGQGYHFARPLTADDLVRKYEGVFG